MPEWLHRQVRAWAEKLAFTLTPQHQADTLPPIFDYWAGLHVSPKAHEVGVSSPESFYFDHIVAASRQLERPVRVLSLGCGAAHMEIALVERAMAAGLDCRLTCMDFNSVLMRSARMLADERGLHGATFEVFNCNVSFERPDHDVIVVNQFFHHVTDLESFCESIRRSLSRDGVIVTSDVIGRNGHQLWPGTQRQMDRLWAQLPLSKTFDRHSGKRQAAYLSIDHAAYSNEGVRAQDVVRCLLAHFEFELFFTFGGVVMPFVERRIGFNFSADSARDRQFIDMVAKLDQEALARGEYPPVNMVASLRHKGMALPCRHAPIAPDLYLQLVDQQIRLTERAT